MKKEQLYFQTKQTHGAGRNTADVYIGIVNNSNRDDKRVQFSLSPRAIALLNAEYVQKSNVVDMTGNKRRIYFMPSDASNGYKVSKGASKNRAQINFKITTEKEYEKLKLLNGKSYSLVYDTECNLFFVEDK